MIRANVSKFGHKGGANCLWIFPKTMYLRKAVLLDDFASWRTRDHPCFFVTTDKLAYADFRRCVPFFYQAAGDLYEALPRPAVKQNSLLYII